MRRVHALEAGRQRPKHQMRCRRSAALYVLFRTQALRPALSNAAPAALGPGRSSILPRNQGPNSGLQEGALSSVNGVNKKERKRGIFWNTRLTDNYDNQAPKERNLLSPARQGWESMEANPSPSGATR